MTKKSFTWRREWILPFESPFSVFEKFKYANNVNNEALAELIKIEDRNKKLTAINLLTLVNIDNRKVTEVFEYPVMNETQKNITHLLGPLPLAMHKSMSFLSQRLRYCTQCMEIYYHSIFHQFVLLKKCPFHNVYLSEKCPCCGKIINFVLSKSHPFSCDCGFNLAKNTRTFKEFIQLLDNMEKPLVLPNAKDDKFNFYLNLTDIKIFIDNTIAQRIGSHNDFMNQVYCSINDNASDFTSHKYKKTIKSIDSKDIIPELYFSTRATVKAIARHIRKRVLRSHNICLKQLVKNKPYDHRCVLAFSYAYWRMAVEHLSIITSVDNGQQRKPSNIKDFLVFASRQDQKALESLYEFLSHNYPHQPGLYVTIINKYLSVVLLKRFWLIVNHVKEAPDMKEYPQLDSLINTRFEMYLIIKTNLPYLIAKIKVLN